MSYPEGIEALSKKYRLVVPQGVAREITKPPGPRLFQRLVEQKSIDVVKLSVKAQARAAGMAGSYAQLHSGEREAIALLETEHPRACIVSDRGPGRSSKGLISSGPGKCRALWKRAS